MQKINKKTSTAIAVVAALSGMLWCGSVFGAIVPQIASAMGREMDRQIVARLGQGESPAQGISLSVSTPVNVNNLEASNALARQMEEELARWFVQAGYEVHEIRKGAHVLFEPDQGEFALTRNKRLLGKTRINSQTLLVGTYTITPQNVRFNIRIVAVGNREVLAMSTMSVPISREVGALLSEARKNGRGGYAGTPMEPTVVTLLP